MKEFLQGFSERWSVDYHQYRTVSVIIFYILKQLMIITDLFNNAVKLILCVPGPNQSTPVPLFLNSAYPFFISNGNS